MRSFRHVIGAGLLIAGTAIGAGMLALPVVTGAIGFFPACLVYFISYLIMTSTGILFVEVCLNMPKGVNIISLSNHYLGKSGRTFAWIVYLFLFYCLSIAYISGGGEGIYIASGNAISHMFSTLIFVFVFAFFVYLGAQMVDRTNFVLMMGLIITYLGFVFFGISHIETKLLMHTKWSNSIFSFPVVLVSFGYQGIIPSLVSYLKRDVKKIYSAIFIGTSLALIIYIIFELLILGIIPLDSLINAKKSGMNAIDPMRSIINVKEIYTIGQFFSFFAITTSFLGVSLGLFDFLADGLRIQKKGMKKVMLALATFLPPTFIAIVNPGIFLIALNYAGSIGGALLLILLPTMLVWAARYKLKENAKFLLPGGRFSLVLLILFAIFIVAIGIYQEIIVRYFY